MVSPPPDYTANITISFTAFRTSQRRLKTKLFSTWMFTTKHEVAFSNDIYIKAGSVSWWRQIFSHNAILCSVRNPCYLEKWSVHHFNLGQAWYFIYLSSLMIIWFSKQGSLQENWKMLFFFIFIILKRHVNLSQIKKKNQLNNIVYLFINLLIPVLVFNF